jgi:hypothetical protein
MIDLLLGLIIFAATTEAGPAACAPLSAALAQIHRWDWAVTSEAEVKRAVPLNLKVVWESEGDEDCTAHRYVSDSDEDSERTFWARFESRMVADRCTSRLTSITYWCDFVNRADGEQFRKELIELLRPGGEASGAGSKREFAWRSGDSQTRFNLFTDIVNLDSRVRAFVRLIHSPITPAQAENLPFERMRHGKER